MKKIFVIGNIGSGKSSFVYALENKLANDGKKVASLDLDKLGHMAFNCLDIKQKINKSFGNIEQPCNLSKIVFSDKKKLEILNDIMHPKIYDDMLNFFNYCILQNIDYCIVEESAYSGSDDKFSKHADILICVYCDEGLRQARCVQKGIDIDDFFKRSKMQLSTKKIIDQSDYAINNNGDKEALVKAINLIAKKL